mmetsp:Transcript_24669/g.58706  ORF Transcript_24669/g.58706 Transcript_24669/m.58706 type:complete len:267 (-) Transcript_24669:1453-2253(-)
MVIQVRPPLQVSVRRPNVRTRFQRPKKAVLLQERAVGKAAGTWAVVVVEQMVARSPVHCMLRSATVTAAARTGRTGMGVQQKMEAQGAMEMGAAMGMGMVHRQPMSTRVLAVLLCEGRLKEVRAGLRQSLVRVASQLQHGHAQTQTAPSLGQEWETCRRVHRVSAAIVGAPSQRRAASMQDLRKYLMMALHPKWKAEKATADLQPLLQLAVGLEAARGRDLVRLRVVGPAVAALASEAATGLQAGWTPRVPEWEVAARKPQARTHR